MNSFPGLIRPAARITGSANRQRKKQTSPALLPLLLKLFWQRLSWEETQRGSVSTSRRARGGVGKRQRAGGHSIEIATRLPVIESCHRERGGGGGGPEAWRASAHFFQPIFSVWERRSCRGP